MALKLNSKNISTTVTLIIENEQEEAEYYDDAQSSLLWNYDEFATAVVAAENKKKSMQKLKGLVN